MKKLLVVILLAVSALAWSRLPGWSEEGTGEDGGVIIFTRPVKAVIFDHKLHVEEQGLDCDGCHDEPFEMAAGTAEEGGDFTMKAIYQGRYCGSCHDGETAFASNTRCTACHIGVKGYSRINLAERATAAGRHR